ncbi:signal peptidase I [Candidatus Dependentiae bacterium]|nr:signal peptidase I [Candidatus Dependentiae bacterium]
MSKVKKFQTPEIISSQKKAILLVASAIILIIIFRALASPCRYTGDCMKPALKEGSLYFLNRLSPYFRSYRIGDIVVFKYEEKDWVARIVALENDTIKITFNNIMVNNATLQEVNIQRNWVDWHYGTYAIESDLSIPTNHVYVLSDNLSAHHDDSRVFGPIPKSSLSGVLW